MAVSTIADDKKKALNLAIAQIEKTCGKGAIMRMGQRNHIAVRQTIDSRSSTMSARFIM